MGLFSASEVSIETVQRDFGATLIEGETVLVAFKTIRDTVFLTNFRFVMVDVQGLTGQKVAIGSVPWRSVTKFSVETAGSFDLDADLKLWVSGQAAPIEVKINRNADTAKVQRLFAQHILMKAN